MRARLGLPIFVVDVGLYGFLLDLFSFERFPCGLDGFGEVVTRVCRGKRGECRAQSGSANDQAGNT